MKRNGVRKHRDPKEKILTLLSKHVEPLSFSAVRRKTGLRKKELEISLPSLMHDGLVRTKWITVRTSSEEKKVKRHYLLTPHGKNMTHGLLPN